MMTDKYYFSLGKPIKKGQFKSDVNCGVKVWVRGKTDEHAYFIFGALSINVFYRLTTAPMKKMGRSAKKYKFKLYNRR